MTTTVKNIRIGARFCFKRGGPYFRRVFRGFIREDGASKTLVDVWAMADVEVIEVEP